MKKVSQSRWKEAKEPEGKNEPQKEAIPEVFDVVFSSQQLERELEGFAVNMGLSWGPPVHICTHHKNTTPSPHHLGSFCSLSLYIGHSLVCPELSKKGSSSRKSSTHSCQSKSCFWCPPFVLVCTYTERIAAQLMLWCWSFMLVSTGLCRKASSTSHTCSPNSSSNALVLILHVS